MTGNGGTDRVIGSALVRWTDTGAQTLYMDGAHVEAWPHDSPDYREVAARHGYGADTLSYCRWHEVAHHRAARLLWADGRSAVLWPMAHGEEPDAGHALAEEAVALLLQRWWQGGERPILAGVDWMAERRWAMTAHSPSLK